ncbi:MAG: hypothetical protein ACE5IE_00505 [Dehalococcoidia bacterium]
MAKLVCVSCAYRVLPAWGQGHSFRYAYYPAGEDHGSIDAPKRCGKPMKLEQ